MLDFGNITTTTPQLQLVRQWMEGYHSLDMGKVEELSSKDYKFHGPFNTSHEHKSEHFVKSRDVVGSMKDLNVRIRHQGTALKHPG